MRYRENVRPKESAYRIPISRSTLSQIVSQVTAGAADELIDQEDDPDRDYALVEKAGLADPEIIELALEAAGAYINQYGLEAEDLSSYLPREKRNELKRRVKRILE